MVIAINDNHTPRAFNSIDGYKYWCERQVEQGLHPDEIIVNEVYKLNEGEECNESNSLNMRDFHIKLYDIRYKIENNSF